MIAGVLLVVIVLLCLAIHRRDKTIARLEALLERAVAQTEDAIEEAERRFPSPAPRVGPPRWTRATIPGDDAL